MSGLVFRNAETVRASDVPTLAPDAWRGAVLEAVRAGARIIALVAEPPAAGPSSLLAILADDAGSTLSVVRAHLDEPCFPSLTGECPQVALFERELAEQSGIRPEGHPRLAPVRVAPNGGSAAEGTDFYHVAGDEVHEVAVGPVHAGIIEPGHFRFQCHGERVLHLEIALGYQHRGVEAALRTGPEKRRIHLVETLAGDTTVGHATAYCQALESLAGIEIPRRAQVLRSVALELERLANHTGDLGALAGDVGFLPTASYCGRLRGEWLNRTADVCGSRFGRGWIRPGGSAFDIEPERVSCLVAGIDATLADLRSSVGLLWSSPSVLARFERTGSLSADTARAIGLVGPAARACGLPLDVRRNHPTGAFRCTRIPVARGSGGDVFARASVRWQEIEHSAALVRAQLGALPPGPVRSPVPTTRLAPNRICVSLVEAWRGEIAHVAMTDAFGALAQYKIIDPSFRNWTGLALALRGQAISDFPLCNKSFNLSYCGFDL